KNSVSLTTDLHRTQNAQLNPYPATPRTPQNKSAPRSGIDSAGYTSSLKSSMASPRNLGPSPDARTVSAFLAPKPQTAMRSDHYKYAHCESTTRIPALCVRRQNTHVDR